jgi:hypothetical protein
MLIYWHWNLFNGYGLLTTALNTLYHLVTWYHELGIATFFSSEIFSRHLAFYLQFRGPAPPGLPPWTSGSNAILTSTLNFGVQRHLAFYPVFRGPANLILYAKHIRCNIEASIRVALISTGECWAIFASQQRWSTGLISVKDYLGHQGFSHSASRTALLSPFRQICSPWCHSQKCYGQSKPSKQDTPHWDKQTSRVKISIVLSRSKHLHRGNYTRDGLLLWTV